MYCCGVMQHPMFREQSGTWPSVEAMIKVPSLSSTTTAFQSQIWEEAGVNDKEDSPASSNMCFLPAPEPPTMEPARASGGKRPRKGEAKGRVGRPNKKNKKGTAAKERVAKGVAKARKALLKTSVCKKDWKTHAEVYGGVDTEARVDRKMLDMLERVMREDWSCQDKQQNSREELYKEQVRAEEEFKEKLGKYQESLAEKRAKVFENAACGLAGYIDCNDYHRPVIEQKYKQYKQEPGFMFASDDPGLHPVRINPMMPQSFTQVFGADPDGNLMPIPNKELVAAAAAAAEYVHYIRPFQPQTFPMGPDNEAVGLHWNSQEPEDWQCPLATEQHRQCDHDEEGFTSGDSSGFDDFCFEQQLVDLLSDTPNPEDGLENDND